MTARKAILATLALCTLAHVARAETPAALVVLPGAGADVATARSLRLMFLRTFAREEQVRLVDPLRLARGLAQHPRVPDAETLRRARALVTRRRFRAAERAYRRILGLMKRRLGDTRRAVLAEITMQLARAAFENGRRRGAKRQLLRLLTWRRGQPTPPDASEGFQHAVSVARGHVARLPTGSLRIASVPARAEAFLDGRRLGPTPTLASNLTVGVHYLTLKLEGYQRSVMPVEVSRQMLTVSVNLRPDPATEKLRAFLASLGDRIGAATLEPMTRIFRQLQLERGIFLRVEQRAPRLKIHAYYYDLRRGALLGRRSIDIAEPLSPEKLAPIALWRPAAVRDLSATNHASKNVRIGRPWYQRWWVWAAAAGVATAALVIPLSLGGNNQPPAKGEWVEIRW